MFFAPGSFERAATEFRWSIRQNADFWRSAVLYTDVESARRLRRHLGGFREVVVDDRLPPEVDRHRKWNCKGWWAKRAVERFGRVLYCDFDIYVRRPPDATLAARLDRSPMFLDIPAYWATKKMVGCGCVYYDGDCDWTRFLDLLYHKWRHDERAWTEALGMTQEKLHAEGRHMSPYIVDQDWLLRNRDRRHEAYIVHGVSPCEDGRAVLRRIFEESEIDYYASLADRVTDRLRRIKRRLRGLVAR
jgi:hypothetical protein